MPEEISTADQFILAIYKFVMPAVAIVFTVILGFISSWVRKISADMSGIREALVKHETIRDQHTEDIQSLKKSDADKTRKIHQIEIEVAKLS